MISERAISATKARAGVLGAFRLIFIVTSEPVFGLHQNQNCANSRRHCDAKSGARITNRCVVPEPRRTSQLVRPAKPRATADHMLVTSFRILRIVLRRSRVVVLVINIRTPLPYISRRIEDSIAVRREASDRGGVQKAILSSSAIVVGFGPAVRAIAS